MPNNSPDPQWRRYDGTSQASRLQAALAPEYVPVDERCYKDLLAFARKYAKELRYYEADNQPREDWSAFLDPHTPQGLPVLSLDEIVAFMRDPTQVRPEVAAVCRRPHVVLFLTFLHLLRHARDHLNTLTRRHLDFYYQQVLRMTRKPAIPDQVNVLIDVAEDATHVPLAAGTLLYAGTDSLGQDLRYRTDRVIEANRAQVARLSSIYVARRITDLRAARETRPEPRAEAFMRMLQIALGEPLPGDPLPLYGDTKIDYAFLVRLYRLVNFVRTDLHMTFDDFRRLMQLKRQCEQTDAVLAGISLIGLPVRLVLWAAINRLLEEAGRQKRRADSFTFTPADPTAFEANLRTALDLGPMPYASLPGNMASLDDYFAAVQRLEQFFWMSAEDFAELMALAERPTAQMQDQDWDRVYALLTAAYKAKISAARRARLQNVHKQQSFAAMLHLALGEDTPQDEQTIAPGTLRRYIRLYVRNRSDAEFLESISQTATTDSSQPKDWDKVYRIVEIAQRIREGRGEPVAQQEVWLNLFPAADARATVVTHGTGVEQTQLHWKTFGQGQTSVRTASPSPAVLGWAISSPLLALSEGRRRITLTLGFQPKQHRLTQEEIDQKPFPFHIQLSTATSWIEPTPLAMSLGDYQDLKAGPGGATLQALQCTLTCADTVEALAAPPPADGQIDSPWPVLRLMLRQYWQPDNAEGSTDASMTHYQLYKDLVLVSAFLQVKVNGLTTLQMQNDETVLQANKPFEPFGTSPAVGARFSLGHPEVVRNRLDSLTFTIEWMGVPQGNIAAYYQNYGKDFQGKDNGVFMAQVSLVDKRRDVPLSDDAVPLFNTPDATAIHTLTLDVSQVRYERYPEMILGDDLRTWDRYLQWELQAPDFQHGAYPRVAAQKSLELAAAIVNRQARTSSEKQNGTPPENNQTETADPKPADTSIDPKTYQVNPPYTPKIKRLIVGYSASAALHLRDYQPGARPERLWHIHPFGYHEVQPDARTRQYLFLPHYENEGELYIGLQDVRPPQNLTLLFQMAAGSADPDLPPVPVQWHYLSGNRWLPLDEEHILHDTTRGLINTGIIEFALAQAQPSTLLPAHLYWLRAAIGRYSASVCDTVAIHTQVVSAICIGPLTAPEYLRQPLPAGSITNLVEIRPEITGIRQPYPSYGGRMAEQDSHLYTRVSERLRHKHRALTIWDYEHMILERFPEVYKVKCLPTEPNAPGRVEIVVIPDIRHKQPFNPFEPKASPDLLADIADYLADYRPVWATVHVKNAQYVPVKVRFAVRFRPEYSAEMYGQYLNNELNRFLSPWAYAEGAEIEIGGRIYANSIIHFLSTRPYVDYVSDIKLFRSEDRGNTFKLIPVAQEGYWVQTDRPDGILVAAQQHEIDLITDTGDVGRILTGIGYMKIGLDFIVHEDTVP